MNSMFTITNLCCVKVGKQLLLDEYVAMHLMYEINENFFCQTFPLIFNFDNLLGFLSFMIVQLLVHGMNSNSMFKITFKGNPFETENTHHFFVN